MSNFQIFSDGACDMPLTVANENNIILIPFYVSLDHTNYYKEIVELSLVDFYKNIIDEDGFPKTSLPSTQDYVDAFTPVLEEGKNIISIHITNTLSGSVQSAITAKLMLEEIYPNAKICVYDSWHATGSQTLMLLEMSRMQRDEKSLEDVCSYVEKARADGRIIFEIGSLTHLQKGGRIGKVASLSANLLSIKPLIILSNGEINVGGVSRSRKKAIIKLVSLVKTHFEKTKEKLSDYIFTIGTTNTSEEIQETTDLLKETFSKIEILAPFQIGATIATHTGPGTLGICFMKKYDTYPNI